VDRRAGLTSGERGGGVGADVGQGTQRSGGERGGRQESEGHGDEGPMDV